MISNEDIAREAANRTQYGYAEEYLYLEDGTKFSFDLHNYLIDIYLDDHKYQVIEKSAQMGLSIYAVVKSLFVCDKLGKNTIYFFPTDTDVQDFSKTRVAPMMDNSPHLQEIIGKDDSLGLRRVGRGWLYFRGMKSSIAMKSIPADCLIFDELDEVSETSEALADQRLNHSMLKWRLKLSTPTFDGYGIDREFRLSDRRYWNLICKKCETRNILEFQFPDCVKRVSETESYLQCRKCAAKLEAGYGVWVPEAPSIKRVRGYHVCGLYSSYLDLSDMMAEYESGRRRPEFMRSKLGIPYSSASMRVSPDMVNSCRGDYEMHPDIHTFMGVDQKGDALHIVIGKREKYGKKHNVLLVCIVAKFDELDQIMRTYEVDRCVIDGTPNQHSARSFSERFPGRVFLCYYAKDQKGDYTWTQQADASDKREHKVIVNRTESLDAMYEQIILRDVVLPRNIPDEYVPQVCNLAKENETDDEGAVMRAIYKRLGEDHYAHATNYYLIAMSESQASPKAINVRSKRATAVIGTARHYEQRSRY